MAIKCRCPSCGKLLGAPDQLAGSLGRCPSCMQTLRVPPPSAAAQQAAEPEVPVLPPAPSELRARRRRRPRWPVALAAGLALSAIAAGAAFLILGGKKKPESPHADEATLRPDPNLVQGLSPKSREPDKTLVLVPEKKSETVQPAAKAELRREPRPVKEPPPKREPRPKAQPPPPGMAQVTAELRLDEGFGPHHVLSLELKAGDVGLSRELMPGRPVTFDLKKGQYEGKFLVLFDRRIVAMKYLTVQLERPQTWVFWLKKHTDVVGTGARLDLEVLDPVGTP